MEKALRILMLEDSPDDAELIKRELTKRGMHFTAFVVDTRAEFTKALLTFDPDIVLSDHALPRFNSIEARRICQQLGIDVPFVLVTGAVTEEFAASCVKKGLDDYILKTNLSQLPIIVERNLVRKQPRGFNLN